MPKRSKLHREEEFICPGCYDDGWLMFCDTCDWSWCENCGLADVCDCAKEKENENA